MKYLKMLGLAAVAAMALMAFAASASATTLEVGGVAKNESVTISASLAKETSAILKDSAGTTTDTCTESTVGGKTEEIKNGAGEVTTKWTTPHVGGAVTSLSFGKCTHTTTVLAKGSLSVTNIAGTTNGTVTSSGAEVTVVSTAFGASAVCKTGAGTAIGTLTGKKLTTEHAVMDINGKISCGILGTSTWTGTYTVTSPTGLGVTS